LYKPYVPYYVTQIYFRQKKYNEVIDYANSIMQADHRLHFQRKIKYLLGQSYFKLEQYREALPYLKEYVAASNEVTDQDIYALGYSYYKTGNIDKSIQQFEKLSFRDDSLSQNATYLLGDCFLQKDKKKHARNAFGEAAQLEHDPQIQEVALLNYAKLSYELEFHKEAIQSTRKFIEQFPDSEYLAEAKELLTDIFMTTSKYKEALEVLETMDKEKPKLKEAYQQVAFYRGVELFNDKKWNKALKLFDKSLQHPLQQKINAQVYFWQGEVYVRKGNWSKAIDNFTQFLSLADLEEELPQEVDKATANYNLGYSYYKQQKYGDALTYFSRADEQLQKKQPLEGNVTYQKMYPDVLLRKGDCYFHLGDYNKALSHYQQIVDNDMSGKDYALFQMGILYGLGEDYEKKIEVLSRLTDNYSGRSLYQDDALFELANAHVEVGQPQQAIDRLKTLVAQHPKSNYVQKALPKMGLIYYNQDKPDKAIQKYKEVIRKFPRTKASKSALLSLREVYVDENRPDAYVQFVDSVPEAEVTASTQDSILFQSAEKQYIRGNCKEAVKSLDAYLAKAKKGYFALPAHYFRAQCRYQKEHYKKALSDYEYVINQARNRFTETSLLRAAEIAHYQLENYNKAYKYYQQLYEYSEFKDNNLTALKRLTVLAYKLEKYDKVKEYGEQLVSNEQAAPEDLVEARLYLGKAAMVDEDLSNAKMYFTKVAEATKNKKGVEARYHLARIKHLREKYDASMSACYEVINHIPSYDYWVAKSYILLGDNYAAKGDNFQAKATYKSIVDNYEGKKLREIAQKKLEKLKKEEQPIQDPKEMPDSLMMESDTAR
jgi:tetratricopeptide (TPR) repeat protein